jgi:D-3-phosphoglycerate dehydrogenase
MGKKLVIIGFCSIGQELGKMALGMGMHVLPVTRSEKDYAIDLEIPGLDAAISTSIRSHTLDDVIEDADIISIHVPSQPNAVLGYDEMNRLKKGVLLINTSRGGIIDEAALLEKLEDGTVAGAALDVFNNEPTPDSRLLNHPLISCSPHIGASTLEAQSNIGIELAHQIMDHFEKGQ